MAGARDGQLRVKRGADSPPWALQMFDDDLGLWLTLAQADEEAEMVRAGIPILRGPYVVDFSDIPHDGNERTLWTPQVGDVILHIFPDVLSVVQWDHGALYIGQNVNPGYPANYIAHADAGSIGNASGSGLDSVTCFTSASPDATYSGTSLHSVMLCATTDPVQIYYGFPGGGAPDATTGHVELYALVARAVAP